MELIIKLTIEDGKVVKMEQIKDKVESKSAPVIVSPYAKVYDSGCPTWNEDGMKNTKFLHEVEKHCNELLKKRGYLFLNEVYGQLGLPPSIAGAHVGWVYNEDQPIGDNYVEFQVYDASLFSDNVYWKGAMILDFNVDGDITRMVKKIEAK